jgi:PhnB protein
MAVKPIPEGYHTISPSLIVDPASEAIDFYKRAFGATERGIMQGPDGKIAHAELQIGDSVLMVSDPYPMQNAKSPKELGGTSVSIFLYVEDVDAAYKQAVDAGATVTMEPDDMFWGDRFGALVDPYGHAWAMATHIEDLSEEEMRERGEKAMAEMAAASQTS